MRFRGRTWIGLWLLMFLAVAIAVVARQRAGFATAGRLNQLRERRLALESARRDHERRIQEGSSYAVLVPRAQARLNLRLPSDSEYVNLQIPRASTPAAR